MSVPTSRAFGLLCHPAKIAACLFVAAWLTFAQPGTSYYWLVDYDVHAQIDAQLHGQTPHGETLPGHTQQPPHDHPITLGVTVPGLTLAHPFDAAFYRALLSPAQRLALSGQRSELAVIAQTIALDPPDQPPRSAN